IDIAAGASQGTVTLLSEGSPGGEQIASGLGWDDVTQQIRVLLDPNRGNRTSASIDNYDADGNFMHSQPVAYDDGGACPLPLTGPPFAAPGGGPLVDGNGAAFACNVAPIGIPIFNHHSSILPVSGDGTVSDKPLFKSMMLHDVECDPLTFPF